MFEDSKLVFITHPYFTVNNPTNNLKIYKKAKNSNEWTVIKCKNKEDYRRKVKEHILVFYDYARDEKKAHNSVKEYIREDNSSLFDYFMGEKKDEQIMKENKPTFYEKLIKFYESNDMTDLKQWIYDTSIDGIELNN